MAKVLVADANKCVGCRICEQWCSMTHYKVSNPKKSRISITRSHEDYMDYPAVCRQCADTPCIKACPTKVSALSTNDTTGAVKVDQEKCIACKMCIKACPFNAVKLHPDGKFVIICDLCDGDPQCVKYCPEQALLYIERQEAEELIAAGKEEK
ncbi:MAG: 4Fe-4S dicluster domain-containing protein [Bacillota bacterium]